IQAPHVLKYLYRDSKHTSSPQRLKERAQKGELPGFVIGVDGVMHLRGRMVIPKKAPVLKKVMEEAHYSPY
ncbi:hypothetical protein ACLOJK_028273, partial [Asimina triloba]